MSRIDPATRVTRTWRRAVPLLALVALLGACAHAPLDAEGVDLALTPEDVRADADGTRDRAVIWGGQIVRAENLADSTRLEIVSYPLDARSQRPRAEQRPGARFLVDRAGYLETAEYEPGRSITVRGRVTGTEAGRIGEADYDYPVVTADEMHLWPRRAAGAERAQPRINFGVGIIFSR